MAQSKRTILIVAAAGGHVQMEAQQPEARKLMREVRDVLANDDEDGLWFAQPNGNMAWLSREGLTQLVALVEQTVEVADPRVDPRLLRVAGPQGLPV